MKILHVENDRDWSSIVRKALEAAGHSVISVDSVSKARKHLNLVDIIICDGNLERDDAGDGFVFARELHDQGRKVLVLASRCRDNDIPFIAKIKFSAENLIKMLARL